MTKWFDLCDPCGYIQKASKEVILKDSDNCLKTAIIIVLSVLIIGVLVAFALHTVII